MEKKLRDIPITQLVPHPHNPRKSLGDISQLATDIKDNGLQQNLVVIPKDMPEYRKITGRKHIYKGEYYILVGHRRTAAAKSIGRKDMPCFIEENLTLMEQLGKMLSENTNRENLKTTEIAGAIQMMLEGGEDIKSISQLSGINEKSVRRRVKIITVLGVEAVEAAERIAGRTISLDDYEKLCDIENEDLRAEVIEKLGTAEFDRAHIVALGKQATLASKNQIIKALDKVAKKVDPSEDVKNIDAVHLAKVYRFDSQDSQAITQASKAAASGAEVFYKEDADGAIHVYASGEALADEAKKDGEYDVAARLAKQTEDERIFKLEKAFAEAYEIRTRYVKNLKITPEIKHIAETYALLLLMKDKQAPEEHDIRSLFSIKGPFKKNGSTFAQACCELIDKHLNRYDELLLRVVYCNLESEARNPACCDGEYNPEESFGAVYGFLEQIGFRPSKEEYQLIDGTHPLYETMHPENEGEVAA